MVISDTVVEIFDIQINSLELGDTVHLFCLVLGAKFTLTFSLLLSTTNIHFSFDFFSINGGCVFLAVEGFDSRDSVFVVGEVHETVTKGFNLASSAFLGFDFFLHTTFGLSSFFMTLGISFLWTGLSHSS